MIRLPLVFTAAAALAACAGPSVGIENGTTAPETRSAVGAATITPEDFYARISFLASDALRGRDTPSPGLDAAAAYLVSEYIRLGLEPAGERGTYYQRYPFPLLALDTGSVHFGTVVNGDDEQLRFATDFFVAPAVGAEGAAMNHARLLYVGAVGENDLPRGDYSGAAPLVVYRGEPGRDLNTLVNRARAAALERGATALVVALGPEVPADAFASNAERLARPQRRLVAEREIPVIYLSATAADAIARRAGTSLADLPATPGAPVPLENVEAHFSARAEARDPALAPNVVAVLPGSDPLLRDEYVVLSAHMDHVGVGRPVDGDSIYNGADDDASGTSALVEIAEAFASLPERPARSIIFLNVSGEEKGLLGSRYFSDHPTVPLEQIVANVNIDMIGRNSPDSVVVIGKDYSSLGEVVDEAGARNAELGLVVSDDIWPEERFFFRSDHFNFARKEVPALFFFSGVHEDYHRPSDEVDTIDTDKAARIARLVFHTVRDIANDPRRPVWDPAGLEEVRALTR